MAMQVSGQRGFALLELVVALLIATLAAVFAADRLAERGRDAIAEGHAAWMATLRQAALRYMEHHGAVLAEQGSGAQLIGFSDALRPLPSELRAAGFLSNGFPLPGAHGVGAGIQVVRAAACPADPCSLEVLIYSDKPLGKDDTRSYRASMVGHWLLVSMGHGGAVAAERPQRIAGAAFSFDNPPVAGMAALPVGTVALAITAEQLNQLAYLRVQDHRDPSFQGSASVAGDLSTQSALYVQQHLRIGGEAVSRAICAIEGAIVQEAYGGLLVCRGGRWASAGGKGGGGYSLNSLSGCVAAAANPITGTCACPTGYTPVRIADSTSAVPSEGRTRGYMCIG